MIKVTNYPIEIKVTATGVYRSENTITGKMADIDIHDDIHLEIKDELVNSFVLNSIVRLLRRCKKSGKRMFIKCDEVNKSVFRLVGLDKIGVTFEE